MKRAARILEATVLVMSITLTAWTQPKPLNLPDDSHILTAIDDLVYFVTADGSLYRTDATDDGTLLLRSGGDPISSMFEFKNMAMWLENGSLWRSDGTPSGTVMLMTSDLGQLRVLDSTETYLFFAAATSASGLEIYRTNGTTAGTLLLRDVNPGSADGFKGAYAIFNDVLFFTGNNAATGTELWRSNGTTSGTVLVKDVNPGSGNGASGTLAAAENQLFFAGTDPTHGRELWRTNGTSGGTVLVKDINPGAGDGYDGGGDATGNLLYFAASDLDNSGLWASNGTAAGTVFLTSDPGTFMAYAEGKRFFYKTHETGDGMQTDIWASSGTPASTLKVGSLCLECQFDGNRFLTYNDEIYFVAKDYFGVNFFVWKSDGTVSGTEVIASEELDGSIPFFEIVNGFLFYNTTSQGNNIALNVIDVTDANRTVTGRQFKNVYGSEIIMASVGDFVFFRDHDSPINDTDGPLNPEDQFQLFQTDGMNLVALRDLFGTSFQHTDQIVDLNGSALFSTGIDPKQWWIYDPESWISAGKIQQEVWSGIAGTKVSDIPVDSPLSSISDLTIFETPANVADNYGSRVRGYVIAPETGDYTFWISSDDQGELWLSTDEDPANKTKIAQVTGWTDSRQWDKYASQKSAVKSLEAGRKYYIEALMKEGTGRDHLAVGWQLPDGALERPIPGKRLMPMPPTPLPKIVITSPPDGHVFTPPANITIHAAAEGTIWKVEFYNGTAKLGEDSTRPYSFTWNNVPEGNYTLLAKAIDMQRKTDTDQINVFVTSSPPCTGAGMIRQEFWMGVPGTRVSAIPLNEEPDLIQDRTQFSGPPTNIADNYGSRIRGYICPPSYGQYTFWISGDDNVELWLSTDSSPLNKRKIAYHTGWTNRNEWTKYPTQQSEVIILAANQKYYIEALMKEATGADHVSVGWRLPGSVQQTIIGGAHLIPFESSTQPPCAGNGTILFETWTDIDGTRVSAIPTNTPPDLTGERTIFEAPANVGSNFGTRVRGYICAPATGNYTFWIASDDQGELWLSTDIDPANKRKIAYHTGWTTSRQWAKYSTQQSAPIPLVAGQQYYIEALYKEDEGDDNMAVGWQLPDGTMERPIPGTRLSPFQDPAAASARMTTEEQRYSLINVYPNPAKAGDPQLIISGYEGIGSVVETRVEIINMTGEIISAETIHCGGNCGSYLMKLNNNLVPGLYLVRMKTEGSQSLKRLLVN